MIPSWCGKPCKIESERIAVLKVVEDLYREKSLSYGLYDTWMRLNSGEYQLGSNDELMSLWEERMAVERSLTPEATFENLLLGLKVADRSDKQSNKSESSSKLGDVIRWANGQDCGFRTIRCSQGGYHVQLLREKPVSRNFWKPLNHLFPWYEWEDKQKTNLDLTSLVYCALKKGKFKQIQRAFNLIPVGLGNTTATAVVISALGNSEWDRIEALILADKRCCMTLTEFKSYFKIVSTAVRRTSRWANGESLSVNQVASTAYMELAIGRAANLTDWDDEIAKRCGPTLPLVDPFTGEDFNIGLKEHIRDIIKSILPAKDRWGSWDTFIKSRQKWSPAGSAAGARCVVEGEEIRVNKHSFFEMTPTSEVLAWLDSPPALRARGSEKLEAGKARAIYGTSPVDQTIIAYLIGPLEKNLGRVKEFVNGHNGAHEVADIGSRLNNASMEDIECTMLDYADFNYQHTISVQTLLFEVIEEEVTPFLNPDLNKAARWAVLAQSRQYVKGPNCSKWNLVTQGMFSGVRSTDFMNTILNDAYFLYAQELVRSNLGLEAIDLFRLHKGDDVWISNKSRLWAIEIYNCMSRAGFIFQGSKQIFDRNKGEFLRVLYTQAGAVGYVLRAVATLLIKPIQSVLEMAPQNKATALNSQIHLLFRRGLSAEACEILWDALIPRALRMKMPGGGGVGIPVGVAVKDYLKGGLDLGPPMTMAIGGVATQPIPAPVPATKALERAIPMHMTNDWVSEVSKSIGGAFDAPALAEALHAGNVADSLRPIDRMMSMRRLEKDIKEWKIKVTSTSGEVMGKRVTLSLKGAPDIPAKQVGERLNHTITCYMTSGAEAGKPVAIVDTLMAGIAASPLRDVASAKMALKLSTIEAARQCLKLASDRMVAQKASCWLESLVVAFGPEITSSILEGMRGVGLSYEALLNPIVLSLISKRATDAAILSATNRTVRTRHDWDIWLQKWMEALVESMVTDHHVDNWSHY